MLEVFYYDYYEDFSKNELDGIEELIIKALQTTFKDPRNKFSHSVQSQLLEYAKKKYYPERFEKGNVVIVKENSQIMGITQLIKSENEHLYIEKFYIDISKSANGIGTFLISTVKDYIITQTCYDKLYVKSFASTRGFYEKNGFKLLSSFKNKTPFTDETYRAYKMYLTIENH